MNQLTYQDLLEVGESEQNRMDFVLKAIQRHKGGEQYKTAMIAEDYMMKKNRTIMDYQKILYRVTGEAVPDYTGANYKMFSGFYPRFVTQQVSFSLGNGIRWKNKNKAEAALGENFDYVIYDAAVDAVNGGTSFLFFNLDHVEEFSVCEFVPLYDEENGRLMAGIRFWQIEPTKPLRATLYEVDGYTEYMWTKNDDGEVLHDKRSYIIHYSGDRKDLADNTVIVEGENYNGFPIVPLNANRFHQSEIVGIREEIDAYDLLKSGYCNTVDEASIFYWTINNAGGMDETDLARFVERMKTVHASVMEDDGARAESHTMEAPYQSREAILAKISADLYRDFMSLDIAEIKGGAVTATQITAAYEPMNLKADMFEGNILKALGGLMQLAGFEDAPTFQRSEIINKTEEIQNVIVAAPHLPEDYVIEKILSILGDGDRSEEILNKMDADKIKRFEPMIDDGGENENN